jgi:antitoxin component YwqK of YwqJK toxin-antitoxin module
MKKIIFLSIGIALFSAISAQTLKTENWPNGNKRSEGKLLGEANITGTDSKADRERKLNNTTKDGKWTYWFEDGKIQMEENYDKGVMTGVWKSWYENGQLESEINFNAKKSVTYFQNGAKNSEGDMLSGMIHSGNWIGYYENGKKNYEGSYSNDGKKEGVWKWWDDKGNPTYEQTYKDGNLVDNKDLFNK